MGRTGEERAPDTLCGLFPGSGKSHMRSFVQVFAYTTEPRVQAGVSQPGWLKWAFRSQKERESGQNETGFASHELDLLRLTEGSGTALQKPESRSPVCPGRREELLLLCPTCFRGLVSSAAPVDSLQKAACVASPVAGYC